MIFTSGSTGAPKGVAVSHRSAAAFVDAEARLWRVEREDRVLAGLSVGFDASCEEMWLAWRNGAALVPAPRSIVRAGSELGPWLAQRGVTRRLDRPDARRDVGRRVAGRCPAVDPRRRGVPRAARVAARRRSGGVEHVRPDRGDGRQHGRADRSRASRSRSAGRSTVGRSRSSTRTASRSQPGEPGELVIAGAGVARYLDPVLDTERFPPLPSLGWERAYCTGDIVRETSDGLAFVGRRDHQVKIGGRRIELGEIDAPAARHTGSEGGRDRRARERCRQQAARRLRRRRGRPGRGPRERWPSASRRLSSR